LNGVEIDNERSRVFCYGANVIVISLITSQTETMLNDIIGVSNLIIRGALDAGEIITYGASSIEIYNRVNLAKLFSLTPSTDISGI